MDDGNCTQYSPREPRCFVVRIPRVTWDHVEIRALSAADALAMVKGSSMRMQPVPYALVVDVHMERLTHSGLHHVLIGERRGPERTLEFGQVSVIAADDRAMAFFRGVAEFQCVDAFKRGHGRFTEQWYVWEGPGLPRVLMGGEPWRWRPNALEFEEMQRVLDVPVELRLNQALTLINKDVRHVGRLDQTGRPGSTWCGRGGLIVDDKHPTASCDACCDALDESNRRYDEEQKARRK